MSQPHDLITTGPQPQLQALPVGGIPIATTPPRRASPVVSASVSPTLVQKRTAEEDISELIRKAKASRYVQHNHDSSTTVEDSFEDELTCSVCATIYHNPVMCLDCQHVFCGSCISQWVKRSDRCPACRGAIKEIKDNFNLSGLVQTLLKACPGKARPQEEIEEMDKFYMPGQQVAINQTFSDDDEEDDDVDVDYEVDDEDDDDNVDDNAERAQVHGSVVRNYGGEVRWFPCPGCTQPNDFGFTCPEPIPPPDPVTGLGYRQDAAYFRGHVSCDHCHQVFPDSFKPDWKCECCGVIWCGNMLQCLSLNDNRHIAPIGDQMRNIGHALSSRGPESARFRGNMVETELFFKWKEEQGFNWVDICEMVVRYAVEVHGGIRSEEGFPLGPGRFACKHCIEMTCQAEFTDWWIWYRERTNFEDDRVRCWYGMDCRTQTHNRSHAERLNHVYYPIEPHLRVNNAPPRNPPAVAAAPVEVENEELPATPLVEEPSAALQPHEAESEPDLLANEEENGSGGN